MMNKAKLRKDDRRIATLIVGHSKVKITKAEQNNETEIPCMHSILQKNL